MATYNSIKEASDAYYKAKANNDAAGMKAANDAANTIRTSQGQQAQYATSDINSVAQQSSKSSGALSASGSGGSYTIGSDKGKNFISSAAAGSTMTGGDGSTWRKNNDGTTTISKGGQTWTYGTASSGGGSSGGGSSGGSGNVSVTLPNGTKTSTSYVNGRVAGNLPIGSIIHTAGGDYQITGGSAGNYTSTRYTGSTTPTQNVDYSDLIRKAMYEDNASWEEVQELLNQREAKIRNDPSLSKYSQDDLWNQARLYIYAKQQAEAQLKANIAELEGAYQSSLAGYESSRNQIAPTYQAQRNQTAASSDVNWNGFNEVAAANGLNTGAVGQAALSRAVTLQNNMNALNQSEAEELSKIDLEVAQLTAEYNSAIAKAKASGDADLAAALYQQFNDYINRKQTERENAQALQQAQQEAQAAAQQDAYEVALDLITSGIMPTASQLAAAGMTRADAESLYYQVMAQQAAKSSGRSGGSGGSKKSSSSSTATQSSSSSSSKPVDLNAGLNQIASANAEGKGGNYAEVSRELLNMRRSGSSDKTMADWLEKQVDNGVITLTQANNLVDVYGINLNAQNAQTETKTKTTKKATTKPELPQPVYKNSKSGSVQDRMSAAGFKTTTKK